MAIPNTKPVIFLTFANDLENVSQYLRKLAKEASRLRESLEQQGDERRWEVIVRQNATAEQIFDVFQHRRWRNRVAIYHFGGHSDSYRLVMETVEGSSAPASADGLAIFLGQQRGLKLVFLNGCSNAVQVQALLGAGVGAVISTTRDIDDGVACEFAARFYTGLVGGATIQRAYTEAVGATQSQAGDLPRNLYARRPDGSRPDKNAWPWQLTFGSGAEDTANWTLPDEPGDGSAGVVVSRADLLTYATNVQTAFAHWADHAEPPDPPLYNQPPPANFASPARAPDAYISVLGQVLPMRVSEFRAVPTDAQPPSQELTAVLRGAKRSILVGEPGSGKTAALERLAWLLATAALGAAHGEPLRLPILAPLSRYAGEDDLIPLVTESYNRFTAAKLDAAAMRQLLQSGDAEFVLLLDGLNEMGGRSENGVQALRMTLERHPGLPVHVTVRTADFDPAAEFDRDHAVLPGAQQWSVLRLADDIRFWGDDDPARVSDVRWYLRMNLEEWKAKRLWENIHNDDRLPEMALNPLLLFMLKEVGGESGGELPADRGALMQKFVRSSQFLGKIARKDMRERAERCLEALSWRLQMEDTLVTDVDGFKDALSGVAGVDAEAMREQLSQCRLLLDDGSTLRLRHQLVQEYGAASHLTRKRDGGAALRQKATDERWRETVILALWLDHTLHTPGYLMGLMAAPQVDLRVRVAAATILGQVGDPRFPLQTATVVGKSGAARQVQHIEPQTVELPGGVAQLGGDDPEAEDNEKPGCPVKIAAFALAVYPVTKTEFACFMADGGYEDESLWTPTGRAWLRGEGKLDEETEQQYRAAYRIITADSSGWLAMLRAQGQHMSDEERDLWEHLSERMTEDRFVDWYGGAVGEKRRAPVWWDNGLYNLPTQPVVGVNWYEALAYAAWLSLVTGKAYRLPTEAEWEWAARRSQRRYPWDGDWDAGKCNWSGSRLNRPAPVGVFPHGSTPDGLHDLAGNVFEWTLSLYRRYPYASQDGREDVLADGRRVVRGGSWATGSRQVRCASRAWTGPSSRNYFHGLRLARTLS